MVFLKATRVRTNSAPRRSGVWDSDLFFLHDGRTSDLLQAIEEHAGQGSEANQVINIFNQLSEQQQQDLLNFLRSL